MRVISPLLRRVIYPTLAHSGCLRFPVRKGPVVVTYHGVTPPGYKSLDTDLDGSLVTIDSFRGQLAFLRRYCNVISPEQFLDWRLGNSELPPNPVLLTCDDGLQNVIHMLPIFHESAVQCLFFITGAAHLQEPSMLWHEELYLLLRQIRTEHRIRLASGEVVEFNPRSRRRNWWKLVEILSGVEDHARRTFFEELQEQTGVEAGWQFKLLNSPGGRERFAVLDCGTLHRLTAAGHTVGAHSISHPLLARASDEMAWLEIVKSREDLARAIGRRVWALAYPFGHRGSISPRELLLV